jgi:hypothetical protein
VSQTTNHQGEIPMRNYTGSRAMVIGGSIGAGV